MRILHKAHILLGLVCLGAAGAAFADVPGLQATDTRETVLIVASLPENPNCNVVSPERARELADKASREGAYQRAGVCYLAAGDQALADQSFVKAVARNKAETSRALASNLADAKNQMRQLKLAFRRP